MLKPDFKDISIRWKGHPKFNEAKLIEDELIEVIVQKLEILLFTNRGSVLGEEGMGCDIEYYLWSTSIPVENIRKNIIFQISQYIPELYTIDFDLNIEIFEGEVRDILILDFVIKGYNVEFVFK
jgi:hypothetical protein